MEFSPAVLALIGTIFGGVGLKVIEHWLTKSARQKDDAKEIRDELRSTITEQRQEISELEKDRDRWREDYYELRDQKVKLETHLEIEKAKQGRQEGI